MQHKRYPGGKTPVFLGNKTWAAVKGCHIKIKSMMSEDHNLGGQPGQQAAGNL